MGQRQEKIVSRVPACFLAILALRHYTWADQAIVPDSDLGLIEETKARAHSASQVLLNTAGAMNNKVCAWSAWGAWNKKPAVSHNMELYATRSDAAFSWLRLSQGQGCRCCWGGAAQGHQFVQGLAASEPWR